MTFSPSCWKPVLQGKRVAAYGAAAKGNTLMNYAGIRPDLISFVVDRNPAKHGKYTPGSRIPDSSTNSDCNSKSPTMSLSCLGNLQEEVIRQLAYIRAWGGQFVSAVPQLRIT